MVPLHSEVLAKVLIPNVTLPNNILHLIEGLWSCTIGVGNLGLLCLLIFLIYTI